MAQRIARWMFFLCIGLHLTPFGLVAAFGHSSAPLKRLSPRLVSVPVKIGEAGPFEFLLDTGTETTLLDEELAARLQMKPVDRMLLSTPAGSGPFVRYRAALSIGGLQMESVEVLGSKIPALKRLHDGVRGVLGLNVLRNFTVRIDWKKLRLDLYEPGESFVLEHGTRLPIEEATDAIVVTAASSAARHGGWRLAVDSGASEVLIFEDRFAAKASTASESGNWFFATATDRAPAGGHRSSTLRLGNKEIRDVRIFQIPAPAHRPDSNYDGLLPGAMFSSVLIDFVDRFVLFGSD